MTIEWFLYLAGIVDGVGAFLALVGTFSLLAGIALTIICFAQSIPAKKISVPIAVFGLLFCLIATLIPSEKSLYLILGAHLVKSSDIPDKVEAVIEKKLDEYLKEDDKK